VQLAHISLSCKPQIVTIINKSENVDRRRPTIFAHRGSSAYAPENTLAAFKLAIEQHADAIELDAKLSADGQIVVMHDKSVDRTTDGTGLIKSLSLNELKKLDAGAKFNQAFKGEAIPTLTEVFEQVGQRIFINVELTNYSSPLDDLPERVSNLVRKFHLESSILLSSFNPIALIRARKILPKVAMGLLTTAGMGKFACYSRLVRFSPLLALHPTAVDTSEKLIAAIHSRDSHVNVYTVNQPDDMRWLFLAGVDGIFTDDLLMAQKVLAELLK
jgi:glycerophosphoryl diester phosphodiesterase